MEQDNQRRILSIDKFYENQQFVIIWSLCDSNSQFKNQINFTGFKNGIVPISLKRKYQKIAFNQKIMSLNLGLPCGWSYVFSVQSGVLSLNWSHSIIYIEDSFQNKGQELIFQIHNFLLKSQLLKDFEMLLQDILYERVQNKVQQKNITNLIQYVQASNRYCWKQARTWAKKGSSENYTSLLKVKNGQNLNNMKQKISFIRTQFFEQYQKLKLDYILADEQKSQQISVPSFEKLIKGQQMNNNASSFIQNQQDDQIKEKYIDSVKGRLQRKYGFQIREETNFCQSIEASLKTRKIFTQEKYQLNLQAFYAKNSKTLSLKKKISIFSEIIDWLYVFRNQQGTLHLDLNPLNIKINPELKINIFNQNKKINDAKYLIPKQQSYEKCQMIAYLTIVYQCLTQTSLDLRILRSDFKKDQTNINISHKIVQDPELYKDLGEVKVLFYMFFKILNCSRLSHMRLEKVPYLDWMTIIMNNLREIHTY